MSDGNGNGHLKVECSSTRTFEFAGNYLVPCDVIKVYSDYLDLRRTFLNEGGETVPSERLTEFNAATVVFVRRLIGEYVDHNQGKDVPFVDAGVALRFITMLGDENGKLLSFFEPTSPGRRSSPGRSELIFSTSEDG